MKLDRFIRLAIGLVVTLVFIIAIAALLFMTESALNVWDRLVQGPRIILYIYLTVMVALVVAAIWLIARLVVKRKIAPDTSIAKPHSKVDIEERLKDAERSGVDVSTAQAEL
jgi:membrane protein implicated in regulation of membrane protease activity